MTTGKGSQFYLTAEAKGLIEDFSLRRGPSMSSLVEAFALELLGEELCPDRERVVDDLVASALRIQAGRRQWHGKRDGTGTGRD